MSLFGKEEPETVEVKGKPFRCQACGNQTFWQQRAQLHSGVATFFNVEWASPNCICLICSDCGYIHWFLPQD
jgi:predicted nucleic-acid-binding Zn-ribbon protein